MTRVYVGIDQSYVKPVMNFLKLQIRDRPPADSQPDDRVPPDTRPADGVKPDHRKYARRKLVSNWDRYEDGKFCVL